MNLPLVVFGVLCFLDVFRSSYAWDNDELEVFDVVEEVNQNFYDVLGVTQVLPCRYVQTYIYIFFFMMSMQLCEPD